MKFVYLAALFLALGNSGFGQCFPGYYKRGSYFLNPIRSAAGGHHTLTSAISTFDANYDSMGFGSIRPRIDFVAFPFAMIGYSLCVYYNPRYNLYLGPNPVTEFPMTKPPGTTGDIIINTKDYGYSGNTIVRGYDELGVEYQELYFSWNFPPLDDEDCGCKTASCSTQQSLSDEKLTSSNTATTATSSVNSSGPRLSIPIGIGASGQPVELGFYSASLSNPGNVAQSNSNKSGFDFISSGATRSNPNPQTTRLVSGKYITEVVQDTVVPSRTTITVKKMPRS
ncbi:MAG: hypothetical protein HC845_04625 [Akkermansiaceae bacterium]|nr:hypothetical protein [Akkermansiaceae bacterium]